MAVCPHCAAGGKPVWQPHTREFVHRHSVVDGATTNFSITICHAPPDPPDPNQVKP